MTKKESLTWDEKKINDLIRERHYDRADIPDDLTIKISKKVTLDDEILKYIWLIKKKEKGLKGEKPVIKAALRHFLDKLENR